MIFPAVSIEDHCRGSLLGLAVGDALGAPVEFALSGTFEPVVDMRGGGRLKLPPGYWTDDTSMALCLADSLIGSRGFNARDQMDRYVRWFQNGHNSAIGRAFGVGKTVIKSLTSYMRTGAPLAGSTHPHSAGNGSLMRLAPIPIFFHNDPATAAHMAGESSRTTHALPICVDACRYFALLIWGALHGASKNELLDKPFDAGTGFWKSNPLHPEIHAVASGSFLHKEPPAISGSGFVVRSLEAALWAFSRAGTFAEGALLAVNLGEDADTTGAIYGQLAGAFWGTDGIPMSWLTRLHDRERIDATAMTLYQAGEQEFPAV